MNSLTNVAKAPAVISLLLHDVTDNPQSSGFRQPTAQKYKHSHQQFQQYLNVVEQSGAVVGSSVPCAAPSVLFTFDDGGASAEDTTAALEGRGWKGFFFVTTDLIGTRGFLSRQQICDLSERGHVIGSHSCSHPDIFRAQSRQEMLKEWTQSKDILEQVVGHSIDVASVPGGDIDELTIATAAEAGFRHIFTSEPRTKPWQQSGVWCYGRLMMLNTTGPESLRRWLSHPSVGIMPERMMRLAKSGVKRVLGPAYLRLVQLRRQRHELS